ncbi:hypothetical protein C8F04DRAFT_1266846 [Mycena alexandri]|uniref:Uncharacterized protein n=1 Tax=Mycena alexandri TaxID=1745969 RepID=A0AAD6WY25_9AGAR|nr:hypothetical protein C8F04DRAFT_1266846 [Mycena alexandri]
MASVVERTLPAYKDEARPMDKEADVESVVVNCTPLISSLCATPHRGSVGSPLAQRRHEHRHARIHAPAKVTLGGLHATELASLAIARLVCLLDLTPSLLAHELRASGSTPCALPLMARVLAAPTPPRSLRSFPSSPPPSPLHLTKLPSSPLHTSPRPHRPFDQNCAPLHDRVALPKHPRPRGLREDAGNGHRGGGGG